MRKSIGISRERGHLLATTSVSPRHSHRDLSFWYHLPVNAQDLPDWEAASLQISLVTVFHEKIILFRGISFIGLTRASTHANDSTTTPDSLHESTIRSRLSSPLPFSHSLLTKTTISHAIVSFNHESNCIQDDPPQLSSPPHHLEVAAVTTSKTCINRLHELIANNARFYCAHTRMNHCAFHVGVERFLWTVSLLSRSMGDFDWQPWSPQSRKSSSIELTFRMGTSPSLLPCSNRL